MSRLHRGAYVRGFTLIEVLIVIGIIAILASIVIVAINPSRQFAQARNSQRQANVTTILNAIGQNIADNKGIFICGSEDEKINDTKKAIGTSNVDLESCLVPTYLPQMVVDPVGGAVSDSGYTVSSTTESRITVCAPKAVENALPGSTEICVTR